MTEKEVVHAETRVTLACERLLIKMINAYLSELKNFLRKVYPPFVTGRRAVLTKNEVPVFTFHTAREDMFREQLGFLRENRYHTISADELFNFIVKGKSVPERSIVITFDDGEGSLYDTAFPLLREFGFKAVSFIVPHFIGRAEMKQSGKRWLNWDEIEEMHKSGIIDFQSHTLRHKRIFIGREIMDFYHPGLFVDGLGLDIPAVISNRDCHRLSDFGAPVYKMGSRMGEEVRYLDDEKLRENCIRYVKEHGGVSLFGQRMWRREIRRLLKNEKIISGRFESPQEQAEAISNSLIKAKEVLQTRLNKEVLHLAYPWGEGSELSVSLSKSVGYKTNFWGPLRAAGADPYHIPRLKDDYLFRLPGRGRKSLGEIFRRKFTRRLKMRDIY